MQSDVTRYARVFSHEKDADLCLFIFIPASIIIAVAIDAFSPSTRQEERERFPEEACFREIKDKA